MSEPRSSKTRDGVQIAMGYVLAVALLWGCLETTDEGLSELFGRAGSFAVLARVFAAHVAATLVIFTLSVARRNSSFFDAYWSVIPIPTALWFADVSRVSTWGPRRMLIVALVVIWGVRLTYNWWRGWEGFGHEDWRYVDLRRKTGPWFGLVNLMGIHLFPCVLVFAGCMALWPALGPKGGAFVPLDLVAAMVTVLGITFETVGDRQLWDWRQSKPPREAYMVKGLWRYTRHPNYFGEITFWWGIGLFGLAAAPGAYWVLLGGASMGALFTFISIPMMEKRTLAKRPHYAEHIARTSMLLPWPPRK